MSGRTQYLIESPSACVAMDERHVRAAAEQLERRFSRRVLPAHHDDPLAVVRMGVVVIVRDVRQLLAGDAQVIRAIVVADGEDDGARFAYPGRTRGVAVVTTNVPSGSPNVSISTTFSSKAICS